MDDIAQRMSRLGESKLDLLEKMFEHAPVAIGIMEEPDHRVHYLNNTLQELFPSQSFVSGIPARQLWPDINNQVYNELDFMEALDRSYKTGRYIVEDEVKVERTASKNGHDQYFNFTFQPLKDPNGEVYGVVIIGVDITRIIEASREMADSKRKLKLAMEGADLGFCELDVRDGIVHFASQECLGHYGHDSEEEFTYRHFMNVIHPEDEADVHRGLNEILDKEGMFDIEYRVRRPDGSIRWILFRGKKLFDEQGEPRRLFGITVDVTRQKEAERTLKEAVRLRDDFLAIASHELQTPVTSIKVGTELFERKARGSGHADLARLAVQINDRVDRLSRLSQSLLDISRIKEGRLELNKQPVALDSLIADTLESVDSISQHNITVEGQPQTVVHADPGRIRQVLANLLGNAIKYSSQFSPIALRVADRNRVAIVSVVDRGIGVPEQDRERIFECFYKCQNKEHQTYPGFGLGLYLSRQIIERHGGKIWIEDNPEGGSIFSFSLPKADTND